MSAVPAVPNGSGRVDGNGETLVIFLASFMRALRADGAVVTLSGVAEANAVMEEFIEHQICIGDRAASAGVGTIGLS